jgi:tetratricopeptide (TPR) repeat protein
MLDALDEAVAAGLLVERGSDYAFAHALIQQTIYGELSSPRRARLHLHVGEALEAAPADDGRVDALARHFCAAVPAVRSGRAVAYALEASRRALDRLAFEEAAAVAERALDMIAFEPSPDPCARAALLLAVAEACSFSGDLAGMKEAAGYASDSARAGGSAELLARAAVLYGRWVMVGTPEPRVATLCREALTALHADDQSAPGQRAWLLVTLANYLLAAEGGSAEAAELADEALRLARQGDDNDVLAQALSLRAQSLLGTPDLARRTALAEEHVDLGERLDDSQVRLLGLVMRATTRLEVGDVAGFAEHVAVLGRMAEDQHFWAARFWADTFRVTQALIDGRFDEAEAIAGEVLATGTGDTNAVNAYAAELLLVRREQGRLAEIRPLIVDAVAQYPGLLAFRSGLALADADAGDHDEARRHLDVLAADGFVALPRDQFLLISLALLAETAAVLADTERAAALTELLRPHAGRLVTVSTGIGCFGAVDRFLGMLAAVGGDWTEAEPRFEAALALEDGIGSRPMAARTRLWFARMLVARARAADGDRAAALLAEGGQVAAELGMAQLSADVDRLQTST